MTATGKAMRNWRRRNHKVVVHMYEQTRAGQRATQRQIHASTKQILRDVTAAVRRGEITLPAL